MVKESYSFDQKTDIRNTQGSDVIGIYKIDIDDSTNGNLKKDHVKYLPAAKTGEKKNGNEKVETVPFFKLFQFADKLDKFLLAVGSLASFISGLGFPVSVWLFGELATNFIYFTILQDSITKGDNSTTSLPFDPTDYYDLYDTGRRFALYFVSIGVAMIVSGFIQYSCFDITRERQMRTIQTRFFKSVIHQDIAWFDVHPVGELGSTFSVSMQVVSTAIGKDAPVFITWFATWCGAYGIALWKGWKVALACMAFSPLIVLLGTILGKRMKTMAMQEGKMYAKAGAIAEEVLSSIRTVMAFNGQEKESHRYDSKLKEGSISTYSKGLTMGFGIGAMWFILYCVFSTAFAFGIKLMRDGEPGLEPGNVLTIFICVMMGSMSLGKTFPTLETFGNGLAAAAKLFKIIDHKPKIDSSSDKGEKPDKINGRLELRNVSFTYPARPEVQVLKNFSLTVEPGETVALVGHSGCGKSTVVQLVERFYDADSGEVSKGAKIRNRYNQVPHLTQDTNWKVTNSQQTPQTRAKRTTIEVLNSLDPDQDQHSVGLHPGSNCLQKAIGRRQNYPLACKELLQVLIDGKNVKDLNVSWHRSQIGLVSQEPVLFSTTIKENIQHGNEDITDKEITEAAKKANIHDFISTLPDGYNTQVGDRGAQLSGGQKQRVAIARALVRNPKLLLLDEATSALDNESEAVVQKALEKAQEGRTTIVIAHRLSTIKNADKIIVLEDGKVVDQGTHSELMMKDGLYHKLVEHQMHPDAEDEVVEELEHDIFDAIETEQEEKTAAMLTHMPVRDRWDSKMSWRAEENEKKKEKEEEEIMLTFSMKRLLKMNAPEWPLICIGALFSTIVGGMQPSLALVMGEFLNIFTKGPEAQESSTQLLIGIILGVGILNTCLRVSLGVCFSKAGAKLTTRLRSLTFKAFLKQDMLFFDDPRNRVGILTTRLSRDTSLVQGATGLKIGTVLESLAVLIAVVVVAFISSWKLTLVIIIFLPLMVGMGFIKAKIDRGFAMIEKGSLEQAGQICSETISNIRVVASLTQEETFKKKYSNIINDMCSQGVKRSFLTSILMAASMSVVYFSYAATFTYGSYLVQFDGLPFHLVFRTFAAITFGGLHIGRATAFAPDFTKAKLAAARLFQYMDTKPKIDISANEDGQVEPFGGSIEFQSVLFQYPARPDVTVLHDISFTASPGETVALVGSSGCGKSTTVALLERFYDPVSGTVLTDNKDIKTLSLKWLRSQIGYVGQEPVLFDCSIAENIAYGDNTRVVPMAEIIQAARTANIHNFIAALPRSYETNVGIKGTQLSGGQKQRIAIARALVSNPKILLLDEATSALDSQNEKIVKEALDHAREGRTCIVIAHRLSTIQNADKIAIIHKGEIVEQGTHSELLSKKGIYHKFMQHHKK